MTNKIKELKTIRIGNCDLKCCILNDGTRFIHEDSLDEFLGLLSSRDIKLNQEDVTKLSKFISKL